MRLLMIVMAMPLVALAQVTEKTVCASGCDYAPTTQGVQAAVDDCRSLNSSDPCVISVRGEVVGGTILCRRSQPAKWIIIRSAALAELPPNQRVTPADAGKLAKFTFTADNSGFNVMLGASHYRFEGLEISYTGQQVNVGGIAIGLDNRDTEARQYAQAPHTIVIDRCWIHGMPAGSTQGSIRQGVFADGTNITVRNSLTNDQHELNNETHGFFASNAPGALYLINNRFEAAIGSLTGGAVPTIPGMISTGNYYFGNEYTQDSRTWHWIRFDGWPAFDPSQPCAEGAFFEDRPAKINYSCQGGRWTTTEEVRTWRDWHKNGWECKTCRLVEVEGNYVHDMMDDILSGNQHGHAFLLNDVDARPGADWMRYEYVSIRNNRASRVGQGFVLGSSGFVRNTMPREVTIENNIVDGIGDSTVAPTGILSGGSQSEFTGGSSIAFRRNTTIMTGRASGLMARWNAPVYNMDFRDNIGSWGVAGLYGNATAPASLQWSDGGSPGQGCRSILPLFTGAWYLQNWAMVDSRAEGQSMWGVYYRSCPATTTYVANWPAVQFVNFNGGIDGDYRVCTGAGVPDAACVAASPVAGASSTGGPLGADVQVMNWATAGVREGTPDLAWFEFRVRRADKKEIRYTAYDGNVCTGTIKNRSGATVQEWADGGGSRDRSVLPMNLDAGLYTVRITCTQGRWRDAPLRVY